MRQECKVPVFWEETLDVCGKPAVDEYQGTPMCAEHFDIVHRSYNVGCITYGDGVGHSSNGGSGRITPRTKEKQ